MVSERQKKARQAWRLKCCLIQQEIEMKNIEPTEEERAPAPLDDFQVTDPEPEDLEEEINELEGYREFEREMRGENLTFGDY